MYTRSLKATTPRPSSRMPLTRSCVLRRWQRPGCSAYRCSGIRIISCRWGANLSGLGLRGLETTCAPVIWQQVNLADAQLNRWQAERIHFLECNFQHTQLANATFEQCNFTDCSGVPQGLASARGAGTILPALWQQQCTRQYWPDVSVGQMVNIPTATRFISVMYRPDGRTALSGSRDGMMRQWDLTTGALCAARCLGQV